MSAAAKGSGGGGGGQRGAGPPGRAGSGAGLGCGRGRGGAILEGAEGSGPRNAGLSRKKELGGWEVGREARGGIPPAVSLGLAPSFADLG